MLIGARLLNAGFNIVSVPIMLRLLGENTYGAIFFALVLHGLMSLADSGSGEVIQRQMSEALSRNDLDEVWELNRDQIGFNLMTGVVLLSIGICFGLSDVPPF